jgi:hypothetical protein
MIIKNGVGFQLSGFSPTLRLTNRPTRSCLLALFPIVLGVILRSLGVEGVPSTGSVNWLVGIGFTLTMTLNTMGLFRSRYPLDGIQRGLRRIAGFAIPLSIVLYILVLMIFLP